MLTLPVPYVVGFSFAVRRNLTEFSKSSFCECFQLSQHAKTTSDPGVISIIMTLEKDITEQQQENRLNS